MFEVKNKKNLTKEDYTKFNLDAEKFDYSFLISLLGENNFEMNGNKIYISGEYVNDSTISLVKYLITYL